MKPNILVALAVAVAGCSSIDPDVEPRIIAATISVDQSDPGGLAKFELSVGFDADAERLVRLASVAVIGDYDGESFAQELAIAFPNSFSGLVQPGIEPTLELINLGSTNDDLEFLCDQEVERDLVAFVQITYPRDPNEGWDSGSQYSPFSTKSFALNCF